MFRSVKNRAREENAFATTLENYFDEKGRAVILMHNLGMRRCNEEALFAKELLQARYCNINVSFPTNCYITIVNAIYRFQQQ